MTVPQGGTKSKTTGGCVRGKGKTTTAKNGQTGVCSSVISIFVFIIMIFGMVFVDMQNIDNKWKQGVFLFTEGDQVSMRGVSGLEMNTLFCHSYDVNPWNRANVYLLPRTAQYSQHQQRKHFYRQDVLVESSYNRNEFYLLPASTIHVQACSSGGTAAAELVVIKGLDNWNNWDSSRRRQDTLQTVIITPEVKCSEGRYKEIKAIVIEADHYYIGIAKVNSTDRVTPAFLNVDVTLRRTVYDVKHAKERCLNATSHCILGIAYDSDDDVVVEFLESQGSVWSFPTGMEIHCHMRVMFWVGIFVVLPLGIIALLISCCCCCCLCDKAGGKSSLKKKKLEAQKAVSSGDRDRLVDNEYLPPDYHTVTATSTSVQVE